MHPDIIQQLDKAVAEVFQVMLGHSCLPVAESLELSEGYTASALFSGTIQGVCMVHLELHTAGKLTEQLMGLPTVDSLLSADTVGELCNMIAGSWKSSLAPEFAASALSPPTVTAGLAAAPTQTFRHTLLRVYSFEGHSVALQLALNRPSPDPS